MKRVVALVLALMVVLPVVTTAKEDRPAEL